MRSLLVLLFVSLASAQDYHETLDDYHDFDTVMQTPDLLKVHLDCYLYRGPCTDVMLSYRQHIRDFMAEACGRCSAPQKHMVRVWLEGLARYDPAGYEEYRQLYDPDNKYMALIRAAVADF